MSADEIKLDGMVPDHLRVRSSRILLDALEVQADIGFHEFEIGKPQRLLVTRRNLARGRVAAGRATIRPRRGTMTYLRTEVEALARRATLQSAGNAGPRHLPTVRRNARRQGAAGGDHKPDIYAEARGVGVEITSFSGLSPRFNRIALRGFARTLRHVEQNPLHGL